MNFFQHQETARKRTMRLVLLFALAVLAVVMSTSLVVAGVFHYFAGQSMGSIPAPSFSLDNWASFFTHPSFMWSALICLAIILLGSAFKALQLGGNGIRVALAMNGKHVHPDTTNSEHKKLLNIVTEMAIASGNPVPKVFAMPGGGINAFAAGYNRHQTVIGVTEGAMAQLNRDELQGVIAHEFSHINFGDVKINMRLVALLHGILVIGLIGRMMVGSHHSGPHNSRYSHSNRRDNKSIGIGLALMAIGYGGTLFGNLIKSAVSRQREFLADASAVQFTRNPDGIANALKKIGGMSSEATIESSNAEQFSHFYFSSLKARFVGGWLSTHPPLNERIRRLGHQASSRSTQPKENYSKNAEPSESTIGFASHSSGTAKHSFNDQITSNPQATVEQITPTSNLNADAIIDSIGNPDLNHLNTAKQQLETLPQNLKAATHSAFSARALIYGLIIHHTDSKFHERQDTFLKENAHPATFKALQGLRNDFEKLQPYDTYNLIIMADAALQDQSSSQAQVFKRCAKALIEADKKLSLLEWCIYRLAITPLTHTKQPKTVSLNHCKNAIGAVLYYIAAHSMPEHRRHVISKAERVLGVQSDQPKAVSINMLDKALEKLAGLKPLSKPVLLKALIAAIEGDGEITEDELTLLRMVALILDCPVPNIQAR